MVEKFTRSKKVDCLEKRLETSKHKDAMRRWLLDVFEAVLIVVVLCQLVFGVCIVQDNAMSPSVETRDFLIYYRWSKAYDYGDVLVYTKDGKKRVGRMVGKSHDAIGIVDGCLYRNDTRVLEENCFGENVLFEEGVSFPLRVSNDGVFVLGDHRGNVKDSRVYGSISNQDVNGVVLFVIRNI